MEKQVQLQYAGQAVQRQEINKLGEASGLADDRVFAELFRMDPMLGSTVSKGILPYTRPRAGDFSFHNNFGSLIVAADDYGNILITPFRAFIGSRTLPATEARKNWRDSRSCLSVAEGATALYTSITMANNATGNSRWDLVYAIVTVDGDGDYASRKVKDVDTLAVTALSVATYLTTTMTFAVVQGTPASSPAFPSLPADSGNVYNIPLAYIRIPAGFDNTTDPVHVGNVYIVAPIMTLSSATGASTLEPATEQYRQGGTVLGSTTHKWTVTDDTRPAEYLPPSMSGGNSLIIAMDLRSGTAANNSHQNGQIVDHRNWNDRLFKYAVYTDRQDAVFTAGDWAWQADVGDDHTRAVPSAIFRTAGRTPIFHGFGQSFRVETSASESFLQDKKVVLYIDPSSLPGYPWIGGSPGTIALYIDPSDTGANTGNLRLYVPDLDAGLCRIFIWLDATGPWHDCGVS